MRQLDKLAGGRQDKLRARRQLDTSRFHLRRSVPRRTIIGTETGWSEGPSSELAAGGFGATSSQWQC